MPGPVKIPTAMFKLVYLAVLFAAATPQPARSQSDVISIPAPSGGFAVGRVSYDWVDQSRPEVLSKVPNAQREIVDSLSAA
jgi:hypothetical protein